MNPLRRFIEWRRMVAYRLQLKEMTWLDRAFCVTGLTSWTQKTYHQVKSGYEGRWPVDPLPKFIRIVRVNMKNNSPTCTTKRWWIYTRWGSSHIDLDSSFFT